MMIFLPKSQESNATLDSGIIAYMRSSTLSHLLDMRASVHLKDKSLY